MFAGATCFRNFLPRPLDPSLKKPRGNGCWIIINAAQTEAKHVSFLHVRPSLRTQQRSFAIISLGVEGSWVGCEILNHLFPFEFLCSWKCPPKATNSSPCHLYSFIEVLIIQIVSLEVTTGAQPQHRTHSRYFLGQRSCVPCLEICIPSPFSPSPLWSAN